VRQSLALFPLATLSLPSSSEEPEYNFYCENWEEDDRYLAKQPRKTFNEPSKFLPLKKDREDVYLSL
jgi:hypothetical protein